MESAPEAPQHRYTRKGRAVQHNLIAGPVLAAPELQTTDVIEWVVTYIVPLLFALAAVVIMSRAHQGRTRENAVVAVNLFLGIFLLAAGTTLFAFGEDFVDLIFGS